MIPLGWIGIAVFILVNAYAVKKKKPKVVVGAIVALAIFMFALSPIRSITDLGSTVIIENKFGGHAKLEKVGNAEPHVYMMVGPIEGPWGMSGYSMKIPVLPVGTVTELNKTYGDFRQCSSPDKADMVSRIVELRLVGADKSTIKELEKAFEHSIGNNEDVFIHVNGQPLNMIENKMQGRGGDRSPANKLENVLVKELGFFKQKVK